MNLNDVWITEMKKNLLILCTGNSCRSQMAEGWSRFFWGNRYNVYSAGTQKHGMNKWAMKVMAEEGIDLSSHYSKTINELPDINFDYVLTVCDAAKESCPYFVGGKIVHFGFQDPPKLAQNLSDEKEILAIYRTVRDEIKQAIKILPELLDELN